MRVSEWIIAAFFSWTTLLAAVLPLREGMLARFLVANLIVLLVYVVILRLRDFLYVQYARDWIAQAIMILAYKEMGWFAAATHSPVFEHQWIVWDRLLLDTLHLRAGLEALGPVLPLLMELSYAFVYAMPPLTMGILYACHLRSKADTLLTIYLLGLFLCYAQFPFWPSEPPRTIFPGQDMPNVHTPIRDFNLWLVGNHGIHTSVFPSAHVSGAFAAAMAMLYLAPRRRKLILAYFSYAVVVSLATVYGRYHYAVDAVAGMLIGVGAAPLGVSLIGVADKKLRSRAAQPAEERAGSPAGSQEADV